MLSESLLCFGASSTTMDEEDPFENSDEVVTFNLFWLFCNWFIMDVNNVLSIYYV